MLPGGVNLIFPYPLFCVCHMNFSSHGRHYLIRFNKMRHHVRVTRYADGNELQDAPRRVSTTRGSGLGKVVEKGQMGWSVGAGEGPLSWNRSFSVGGNWSQKCKITLWRSLDEGGKSRKKGEMECPALSDFRKSDFSGRFFRTKNQPLFALILMSLHIVFSLWESTVLWVEERWWNLAGNRLIFVKNQEFDKQM